MTTATDLIESVHDRDVRRVLRGLQALVSGEELPGVGSTEFDALFESLHSVRLTETPTLNMHLLGIGAVGILNEWMASALRAQVATVIAKGSE